MRFRIPHENGATCAGRRPGRHRKRGAVLVGLLWCLVLLSVLVVGILHSARTDFMVARNHADRVQARYLAMAGIERAKALLYKDARERSRSGQSHNGSLFNAPQHFRDVAYGRGNYRVMRTGRQDEGGGVIFGVSDEESRLNLNTAEAADLGKLEGMTPDLPPAILDWRDGDNEVTPGGAEGDYYLAVRPPGRPRNAPFLSVRELLQVRGMPRDMLFGGGTGDVGLPEMDDSGEGGGDGEAAAGPPSPTLAPGGWAAALTVHSGVRNLSATGQERVNVQTADEAALTGVRGITSEIAKAIIAHRGQNRFSSLADLLDVVAAPPQGQPQQGSPGVPPGTVPFRDGAGPRGGGGNPNGRKVIDQNLLIEIADQLTVEESSTLEGVVNVNTAGLEVLACLPGVTRELAQSIINYRSSAGFLASTAALLNVTGMTPELFKQFAPRVTVRSETFRILAEGRIQSTGVRQRVQAVVRVGLSDVETLAYRENDL